MRTSTIVRSCNFQLHQLECMRHYISDEACCLAVLALHVPRLDYCNALLTGASQHQLDKLQRLHNFGARPVARSCTLWRGIVHVTPILQQLHWLPVWQWVPYKHCILVHHCVHGAGPSYLSELLQCHIRDRCLHKPSAMQFTQRHAAHTESRARGLWSGRAPSLEQSPTLAMRNQHSLSDFKASLKAYLWLLA